MTPLSNQAAGATPKNTSCDSQVPAAGTAFGGHKVSIVNLEKAQVLMALYNYARNPMSSYYIPSGSHNPTPAYPPNMYTFKIKDSDKFMSLDEASSLVSKTLNLEYVRGRAIKTDISGNVIDTRRYDRDNGEGVGAMAIQSLTK